MQTLVNVLKAVADVVLLALGSLADAILAAIAATGDGIIWAVRLAGAYTYGLALRLATLELQALDTLFPSLVNAWPVFEHPLRMANTYLPVAELVADAHLVLAWIVAVWTFRHVMKLIRG